MTKLTPTNGDIPHSDSAFYNTPAPPLLTGGSSPDRFWNLENDQEDGSGGYVNPCMQLDLEPVSEKKQNGKEKNGIINDTIKVYPQRWYILVLLGVQFGVGAGLIWNTWGPISSSAGRVFGWNTSDIALLSNWGPIGFVIATPLYGWLIDVKGLRIAAITSGAAFALGSGLRTITSSNPAATWLIHAGHIINGLGMPMTMAGVPSVSAQWFPADERTTATAAIVALNMFGLCISFIIGPLLVRDQSNTTIIPSTNHYDEFSSMIEDVTETRQDIMRLMYIEFGIAAGLFLLVLIYFPAKPPTPPSQSAGVERTDIKQGVKQLFRHATFWKLAVPYALSAGVDITWLSVLHINVKPLGVTESEAGWAGFYSTLAGCASCLIMARFADAFKKRMKLFMILLKVTCVISFGVFALAVQGVIPFSLGLMYACLIVGDSSLSAVLPMFFELCCEATYPIAEGVTNSLLTWLCNVVGLVFLALLMVPNIGTSWTNWCLTAAVAVCIPILLLVKEQYNRLDLDTENPDTKDTKSPPEVTRF